MTQTSPDTKAAQTSIVEQRCFLDVLRGFVGCAVTIVTPERYEDAPLGHPIRGGWDRAKLVGFGNDYIIVAKQDNEPVKQYIPLHSIKRVSVHDREVLVHI